MSCCRNNACEPFTGKVARRDLLRHRSKGLGKVERWMVEAASRGGIDGVRVLEIGGGIGALQAELLAAGAGSGEIVELVPAYEPFARQLADGMGLTGRTAFHVVDLLEEPGKVTPADVVLLNGVLCCTPDGLELAKVGAALTRGTMVLSVVRHARWTRLGVVGLNAVFALRRQNYRSFLRPMADIVAAAESAGLRLVAQGRTFTWEYAALSAG